MVRLHTAGRGGRPVDVDQGHNGREQGYVPYVPDLYPCGGVVSTARILFSILFGLAAIGLLIAVAFDVPDDARFRSPGQVERRRRPRITVQRHHLDR